MDWLPVGTAVIAGEVGQLPQPATVCIYGVEIKVAVAVG